MGLIGQSAELSGRCGALLTALVLSGTGCSSLFSPARPQPGVRPAASPMESDREEVPEVPLAFARSGDAVVRVVSEYIACTGTLIADDRVLTAHHCVVERDENGKILKRDVKPQSLRIELGGDYLPWGEVGVRAIVTPPCGHAAGLGDIAVLVLERQLVGVPTLELRLDETPEVGEGVQPVGFGRCALSEDGIRRRYRRGGNIDKLTSTRFQLEASICPGDSGGPAVAVASGTVVGVISASMLDGSEETMGRTEFTRLDAWRPVFATAQLISEGATPAEVPPVDGCDGR